MVYNRHNMKRLFTSLFLVAPAVLGFAQNVDVQPQPSVSQPLSQPAQLQSVAGQPQNGATHASAAAVQALRFGYLSYDSVMHRMPDYAVARHNIKSLKENYDAEMKRVEDEFNTKYEFFLQDQRSLAPSILQKRQAELQELMEKNLAFKEKATQLLKQAEAEALAPIRKKVDAAIGQVGERLGLAFVLNTDNNAAPWLNPSLGEDVTGAVLRAAE